MVISTFKDNNYKDIDKISIFSWIIHHRKGRVPRCVYECENNPRKLLELISALETQKSDFAKLFDESLSDTEFFEIYKQFYRWDTDAIVANSNKSTFPNPKTSIIKTSDVTSTIESEGHGRDFSWWTEWRHSAYEVITNADFQLEDRVYTKQEIAKLVKQKKLIVLRDGIPYGEELDGKTAYKTSQQLESINVKPNPLHYNFNYYGYAINKDIIEKMYASNPTAFKVIREDLTKERLVQDYERYLVEYNRTMRQINALLTQYLRTHKPPTDKTIQDIRAYLQSKKNANTEQTPASQPLSTNENSIDNEMQTD